MVVNEEIVIDRSPEQTDSEQTVFINIEGFHQLRLNLVNIINVFYGKGKGFFVIDCLNRFTVFINTDASEKCGMSCYSHFYSFTQMISIEIAV